MLPSSTRTVTASMGQDYRTSIACRSPRKKHLYLVDRYHLSSLAEQPVSGFNAQLRKDAQLHPHYRTSCQDDRKRPRDTQEWRTQFDSNSKRNSDASLDPADKKTRLLGLLTRLTGTFPVFFESTRDARGDARRRVPPTSFGGAQQIPPFTAQFIACA